MRRERIGSESQLFVIDENEEDNTRLVDNKLREIAILKE